MVLLRKHRLVRALISCASAICDTFLFKESTTFSSTNTRHKAKTKRVGLLALKGLKDYHFDGTIFKIYGAGYA